MERLSPIELIVAVLAVWQSVEIYHHSKVFHSTRAWMETEPLGRFLSELQNCPFCLSVWVAGFVCVYMVLVKILVAPFGIPMMGELLLFPINALAVCRVANLLNDLLHDYCRTPKDVFDPGDPLPEWEGDDDREATEPDE